MFVDEEAPSNVLHPIEITHESHMDCGSHFLLLNNQWISPHVVVVL